jgi:hypothetical protein
VTIPCSSRARDSLSFLGRSNSLRSLRSLRSLHSLHSLLCLVPSGAAFEIGHSHEADCRDRNPRRRRSFARFIGMPKCAPGYCVYAFARDLLAFKDWQCAKCTARVFLRINVARATRDDSLYYFTRDKANRLN